MAKTATRPLIVTYLPSAALLIALAIASIYKQIPIGSFTRDPAQVANFHPFTGLLSNLGILLWCASAVTCLFSGLMLHHTQRTKVSWFLICSALLTLVFLFDDLFLFHELLAGRYLGLPEKVIYVLLGGVTAAYVLTFRDVLLRSEYAIWCVAVVFFAISVAIDVILERWLWRLGDWVYLVEDGTKFLGLASWCSYYVRVSYQFLVGSLGISPNTGMEPTR